MDWGNDEFGVGFDEFRHGFCGTRINRGVHLNRSPNRVGGAIWYQFDVGNGIDGESGKCRLRFLKFDLEKEELITVVVIVVVFEEGI